MANDFAHNMAAIVLAAGVSQRMGEQNKLLLNFNGQTFLQRTLCSLCDAGLAEVVVVLGHESEQVQQQLIDFPLPIGTDQIVRSVVNPDYARGQMTSVNFGLENLTGNKEGVLICLGDQPLITASHIQELISAFEHREISKQVIVPMFNAQRGNPVVISELARQQVLAGESRPGCRHFIDNNPTLVSLLPVNDAAYITDVDTPEEFRALTLEHWGHNESL